MTILVIDELVRTVEDHPVVVIHITKDSLENFKTLVRRALNTWDRAPAELKEFGDILEFGKIQQDYKSQE